MEQKKAFNSRPIFYGFLALLLALATSRFIFVGDLKYIIFDAAIVVLFLIYCIWAKKFKTLAVILCVFMFGLGWHFVGMATFRANTYTDAVMVEGRVSDDIYLLPYGGRQTIILKNVYINGKKESNINLTVVFEEENPLKAGDIITFETEVQAAKLFELGNFKNSYYRDRTPYIAAVRSENITITGNRLVFAERVRLKVKDVLYKVMGKTNGATAFAALFGNKNDLDGMVNFTYKQAGVVHLLTVSGLHVTFLLVLVGWLLKKCRVRGLWNFLICLIFLVFYSYLCNFTPSILRAGIMGLVLLTTRISGKCYDTLCSVGFAGILILLFSPLSAMDVGFLMSFFCVIAILTLTPVFNKVLKKVFPNRVAGALAVSIASQVGLLPFMAQIGGSVNFLSFFINLLVIPLFSVVYPVLFLLALLSAIAPFMGVLLTVCNWGFWLIGEIAGFFAGTYMYATFKPFDIFFTASLYILVFLISKYFLFTKRGKCFCCGGLAIVCGLFFGLNYVQLPLKSSISYAFDGSASTVVLTNSQNQVVCVDFGSIRFTQNLLNRLEIKQIDAAFVLQRPTMNIQSADVAKVDNIIRYRASKNDEGQGYGKEVFYDYNTKGSLGGFTFVYYAYSNRLIGLEINFDETSVLILKDWTLSWQAFDSLPKKDYDFVILGDRDDYSVYFDANCRFLTYYDCQTSYASYQKHGNVSYRIDGTNYKRRCLD